MLSCRGLRCTKNLLVHDILVWMHRANFLQLPGRPRRPNLEGGLEGDGDQDS